MQRAKLVARKVFELYCAGHISLNEMNGMINSLEDCTFGGYFMANGTRTLRIHDRKTKSVEFINIAA